MKRVIKIAVLAGSSQQYVRFCEELEIPHAIGYLEDKYHIWRIVHADDEGQHLRGMEFDCFVRIGTWQDRSSLARFCFAQAEFVDTVIRRRRVVSTS